MSVAPGFQELLAASDPDLVALSLSGHIRAYGELVRRHAPAIRTHVRRLGAQSADADDTAQDALIIGFQKLDEFRFEGPFPAWIKMIATRRYLRVMKSQNRMIGIEEAGLGEGQEDAEVMTITSQARAGEGLDLERALERLRPAERLCVVMNISAGQTHADIASELGLPLGTVKSHCKRGLERLQQLLILDVFTVDRKTGENSS